MASLVIIGLAGVEVKSWTFVRWSRGGGLISCKIGSGSVHGGLFVRCLVKAQVKPCFSCDLKVITCKGRSGHAGLLSFHFFLGPIELEIRP